MNLLSSRMPICQSFKDLLSLTFILPFFAIIFLYQSVAFGKIGHSFIFPTKRLFPLLNIDFHRPEVQNRSRNRPQLEATGLTSHDPFCSNLNRMRYSYILKVGKVEGVFESCLTLLPTQFLPKL